VALGKLSPETRAFVERKLREARSEAPPDGSLGDRPSPSPAAPERPRRQRKPREAPTQPRKRGRYQRELERDGRERERDRKRAERLKHAVDASGRKYRTQLEPIPERVWRDAWEHAGDPTGRAGWEKLNRYADRAQIGAIRAAAFAELSDVDMRYRHGVRPEQARRRDWTNPRARHIVTIALVALGMKRDSNRYGTWQFTFEGIPQSVFALLCRDPITGRQPSVSAVGHPMHRLGGDLENGQCSYIEALRLSGFLYRLQRRKCAREDGPTCSQFFVVGFTAHASPEQLYELHQLIELDSRLLDLVRPRPPPGWF
jgi:hypothetical protein